MSRLALTLSIVIPVYNEESYLTACLEAISLQTVKPDEVILVDNNSTDSTVEIARRYKFVTVIHEPVQGLIAARNTGMNAARGTLIARIDADSRLQPDWVETVKKQFKNEKIDAITGLALTKTSLQDWIPYSKLWSRMYFLWTEAEFGIPILWGANMVMRKNAWDAIKKEACLNDSLVHEDQDLSYLLAGQGKNVIRNNHLLIKTSGESYHDWQKFKEYIRRRSQTKRYHRKRGTISSRNATKLTWAQRSRRYVSVFIPGVFFIASSPFVFVFKRLLAVFIPQDTAVQNR